MAGKANYILHWLLLDVCCFWCCVVMHFGLGRWHHRVSEFKGDAFWEVRNIDAIDYLIAVSLPKASKYLFRCE